MRAGLLLLVWGSALSFPLPRTGPGVGGTRLPRQLGDTGDVGGSSLAKLWQNPDKLATLNPLLRSGADARVGRVAHCAACTHVRSRSHSVVTATCAHGRYQRLAMLERKQEC